MRIVNCTPHQVVVHNSDGDKVVFEPSGIVPRVSMSRTLLYKLEGVEIFATRYGDAVDMPKVVPGTSYIVSNMTAAACSDRRDLLTPGDPIRDEEGRIIGCLGLNVPRS